MLYLSEKCKILPHTLNDAYNDNAKVVNCAYCLPRSSLWALIQIAKAYFNFVEILFRDIKKSLKEISYAVSKQRHFKLLNLFKKYWDGPYDTVKL